MTEEEKTDILIDAMTTIYEIEVKVRDVSKALEEFSIHVNAQAGEP